jgi:hypothetical protein
MLAMLVANNQHRLRLAKDHFAGEAYGIRMHAKVSYASTYHAHHFTIHAHHCTIHLLTMRIIALFILALFIIPPFFGFDW